jgi:hypothetical protein
MTKTAPALPHELLALTRRLRLPYLRAAAPEVVATAKAQRWDPAEVVRVLLAEEAQGRDTATRELRRRQAAFPSGKTFESWSEQDSSIPLATQRALMSLEWSAPRTSRPAGPPGPASTLLRSDRPPRHQ